MKKTIICLLSTAILMTGSGWAQENGRNQFNKEFKERGIAHREQQKQENQAFRQTLKDLEPAARSAAIRQHRIEQYQENRAFAESIHQERMARVKERLEQSSNMDEAQKAEILARMAEKYQERVSFHEQQHQENLAFMDTVQGMDPEARKQAMQEHREIQKSERKAFREQIKSERQAFRQSRRHGQSDQSLQ